MGRLALIAIVDDDESLVNSLANVLRSMGFRAEAFPSAEAFLLSPAPGSADCLILDVRLPGMDGLDLARKLAIDHRRVPLIFISAYASARVREEASRLGAIAFLTKPCRETDLFAAVMEALNGTNRSEKEIYGND